MTKSEAIEELKTRYLTMSQRLNKEELHKSNEALDMAIKSLEREQKTVSIGLYEQIRWERNIAIEQLKALGYGLGEKPKTDNDCVSRKAILDKIKEVCFSKGWLHFRADYGSNGQRDFLISYIERLQSVTPQTKTAHWVLLDECSNSGYYCSHCQKKLVKEGWSNTVKKIKFCPNCGCKMESEG